MHTIQTHPAVTSICHCRRDTRGIPGRNPVVALTFEEVLVRLVEESGSTEWLSEAASKGYGDAEEHTRRDVD